jgi:uncharacterized protein (TIGR02594 family)
LRGYNMTDSVPAWLDTMRGLDGTKYAPGDDKNPTIIEWLRFIGEAHPNMAAYCASAMSEGYFSWCGLAVGYCMTKAGFAPVFGTTDTGRFLFATAWLGWGTPVTSPDLGDVIVFDFGGGDHHVTFFEKDNGNGTWACHGGNQSHAVMLTNFPKSRVMGIRRPTTEPAVVSQAPVVAFAKPASQRFADCVALVLHDEGGNDDDPRDPGGRTSRGITQREWDPWRQAHPGLPADVWQAPQDQILAIYHDNYWNVLSCDALPAGIDYSVFDYGVLSGVSRAAKVLQGFVGTDVDGAIGPKTIAATAQANAAVLIKQICDERLAFMQGLKTFPIFGKGWTARVQRVLKQSLAMASSAGPQPTPPVTVPDIQTPVGVKPMTPDEIAQAVIKIITAVAAQQGASASATPNNILPLLTSFLAAQQQGAGGQAPVQGNDILQAVLAALLKQQPGAAVPATGSGQDIGSLILGALIGKQAATTQPAASPASAQPTTAATTSGSTTLPPALTTIDKLFGGDTLAGKKTLIAVVAFVIQLILQFSGVPGIGLGTPAGNIITTLLGGLGGLGMVSKVDRVVQLLGNIAGSQPPPPAPPPGK